MFMVQYTSSQVLLEMKHSWMLDTWFSTANLLQLHLYETITHIKCITRRIRVKKLAHSAVMEEMLFLQRISRHREEIDQKTFLNQVGSASTHIADTMRCSSKKFIFWYFFTTGFTINTFNNTVSCFTEDQFMILSLDFFVIRVLFPSTHSLFRFPHLSLCMKGEQQLVFRCECSESVLRVCGPWRRPGRWAIFTIYY